MTSPPFSASEGSRSRVRIALAAVERDIERLPEHDLDETLKFHLRLSFAELIEELALGPEPAVRECPTCHGVGMRAATRCLHCWSKLLPPTG